MIILPIVISSLIRFSLKFRENVLFELGSEGVKTVQSCVYCCAQRKVLFTELA